MQLSIKPITNTIICSPYMYLTFHALTRDETDAFFYGLKLQASSHCQDCYAYRFNYQGDVMTIVIETDTCN